MGIQKVTFDGANVTSKIDSDLHHYLFSNDFGILKGLKQECSYSLANNIITFMDGYVSIFGRIVYIENQTTVSLTPDSSKFGYVVLAIDTSSNTTTIYTKEAVGTYPNLTQTNLLIMDGLFEFVMCSYSKTTTSVTLNNDYTRWMILSDKQKITDLEISLKNRYYPFRQTITTVSNGVYRFEDMSSAKLSESILYVIIGNSTVVTFPGDMLFFEIGSMTSVAYRYAGADYSLGIAYALGRVTLTCGSTNHQVTSVFIKK